MLTIIILFLTEGYDMIVVHLSISDSVLTTPTRRTMSIWRSGMGNTATGVQETSLSLG